MVTPETPIGQPEPPTAIQEALGAQENRIALAQLFGIDTEPNPITRQGINQYRQLFPYTAKQLENKLYTGDQGEELGKALTVPPGKPVNIEGPRGLLPPIENNVQRAIMAAPTLLTQDQLLSQLQPQFSLGSPEQLISALYEGQGSTVTPYPLVSSQATANPAIFAPPSSTSITPAKSSEC